MAAGDITLTNLGVFDVQGTALKTGVDGQNTGTGGRLSGELIFTAMNNAQIHVSKIVVEQ